VPSCDHPRLHQAGLCYYCLKLAALNGHADRLTAEERAFVGVRPRATDGRRGTPTSVHGRTGWVSPLASLIAELGMKMPAADVARLERLAGMDGPGRARLDFLGG
jgi:hypothetical protein